MLYVSACPDRVRQECPLSKQGRRRGVYVGYEVFLQIDYGKIEVAMLCNNLNGNFQVGSNICRKNSKWSGNVNCSYRSHLNHRFLGWVSLWTWDWHSIVHKVSGFRVQRRLWDQSCIFKIFVVLNKMLKKKKPMCRLIGLVIGFQKRSSVCDLKLLAQGWGL